MPVIEEVDDLDLPDRSYPIITGDYTGVRDTWGRRDLVAGTPIPAAVPVFTKLDDPIVNEELARMRGEE
jgi:methionyl-tRNA synthetase